MLDLELSPELRYRLLELLASNPHATQREIAAALGVSLGKANYCIRSLLEKGFVKARNFKNARSKLAYAYVLTPVGIEEKARVTWQFLKDRLREYDRIAAEIELLRAAAMRQPIDPDPAEKREGAESDG